MFAKENIKVTSKPKCNWVTTVWPWKFQILPLTSVANTLESYTCWYFDHLQIRHRIPHGSGPHHRIPIPPVCALYSYISKKYMYKSITDDTYTIQYIDTYLTSRYRFSQVVAYPAVNTPAMTSTMPVMLPWKTTWKLKSTSISHMAFPTFANVGYIRTRKNWCILYARALFDIFTGLTGAAETAYKSNCVRQLCQQSWGRLVLNNVWTSWIPSYFRPFWQEQWRHYLHQWLAWCFQRLD